MKNMERGNSEDPWKKAFEKAEISPSENVWTNIELELERARGGELKKRLLFYKLLAAASVVFAMAIGGVGYYYSFNPNAGTLADNASQSGDVANHSANNTLTDPGLSPSNQQAQTESAPDGATQPRQINSDFGSENQASTSSDPKDPVLIEREKDQLYAQRTKEYPGSLSEKQSRADADVEASPTTPVDNSIDDGKLVGIAATDLTEEDDNIFRLKEQDVTPLYTRREVRLTFEKKEPEVDPVVAMLAMLDRREREMQDEPAKNKKGEEANENLWTSIGFAAGSFNANQSSSQSRPSTMNAASAALAAPIVDQETKATGYSYSMGVNVGKKISDRWVLQGGVNYLTHSSEYTANNVVMEPMSKYQQQRFRAASTNDLVNTNDQELSSKLVYSAPYNVNNSMRYLSIPMQAGYMVVNKTFGLQLNAGVATDLFLQNTVKAESDQLAKTSQPAGSDSPYRAVNLSGLFGTEVSYRFGPHYRVSLNPGIRYPFNTIYKSEMGVQSTPLTFDVGLRFRYIFN